MNNFIINFHDFRTIANTNGRYIIDSAGLVYDTNLHRPVSQCNNKYGYKFVNLNMDTGKRYPHVVHRLVAAAFLPDYDETKQVDHRDNCKTNNNIANLRICSHQQNQMNKPKTTKQTTSKFKGVSFHKLRNKYQASIMINGISKYLGRFETELEAAIAYNNAAALHHGEFACLNKFD